jgi:hypothetical protein
MSFDILLFGGRNYPHPQARPVWHQFQTAVMLRVRDDGEVVARLEYEGGPIEREIGLSCCFKAATIIGDHAYACTNTEVLKIDLRNLSIVEHHSHRFFNDLHHVNRIDDRFFVAGTGIDSVLEYDAKFDLIKRHPIANDEIIERFGHEADYRRIHNTKPHLAHPNYVESWGGEVWVSNFDKCRVESLTSDRKYVVSEFKIHDGVPAHGKIWFTSVNGRVITLDPRTGAPTTYNLEPMSDASRLLGWCRGIAPISDTDVLVGFSKLRETKARENLKWIGNKLLGQSFALSQASRIARYDLARATETWRLETEKHGMDAMFSIHVA